MESCRARMGLSASLSGCVLSIVEKTEPDHRSNLKDWKLYNHWVSCENIKTNTPPVHS
ncbi:hypothetical protein DAI22_04g129750 [Oryza sativa Japonica Group]|nr:hypothetical protein DAI22_04g129750 [Oryza sativa Japonica Group]